jgi:hypothetical protein
MPHFAPVSMEKILRRYAGYQWYIPPIMESGGGAFATTAVAGSGAVAANDRLARASTSTTQSSTAYRRTKGQAEAGFSIGKNRQVFDWDKRVIVVFVFHVGAGTTNGKSRLLFGKASEGVKQLDDKGIGIEVHNLAVKGTSHDGSSRTETDLSTTLTTNIVYAAIVTSDGSGNVEYFIDGVSKATDDGGPSGDSTAEHQHFHLEAENNDDAADQAMSLVYCALGVEQ